MTVYQMAVKIRELGFMSHDRKTIKSLFNLTEHETELICEYLKEMESTE